MTESAPAAAGPPPLVFAADDDPLLCRLLQRLLTGAGYRPRLFPDAGALLAACDTETPDLVLTDLQMPRMDGRALLAALQRRAYPGPVVMLTGTCDLPTAMAAIHAGAADYVAKPLDPDHLLRVLQRALRVARLERENARQTAELQRRDAEMRDEMATARRIHRAILPVTLPALDGFTFGSMFVPSQAIGGDLIDFYPDARGERGTLGVMFADISGHGVAAALLSMLFKTAAAEAFRAAVSPVAGMTELNERLVRDFPEGQFACVTYLELLPGARTVRFVRGSQEPLLLLTRDGVVREFADGGTPPGMFTAAETGGIVYGEQALTLAPGESIVLYTDGVAEVCSPEKQLLGIATLHRWLAADRALPPEALARELHRRVTRYTRTTQLPDDFTVFIARAV